VNFQSARDVGTCMERGCDQNFTPTRRITGSVLVFRVGTFEGRLCRLHATAHTRQLRQALRVQP
jgi:hypothetical protein